MSYTVHLPHFEGPLDLLLHLIEKNQMDIQEISMSTITAQYLETLENLRELDLEVTSAFIVMAATLLVIKARTLLPRPAIENEENEDEGPDPREELIKRLLQYKQFKEASLYLKQQEQIIGRIFTRENSLEKYQSLFSPEEPLAGVDILVLIQAFQRVLKRADQVEPPKISATEIRLEDKMAHVMRRLFLFPLGISFVQLFSKDKTRGEIVVTFLAILELLRLGQVDLKQKESFSEIIIYPVKKEGITNDHAIS